MIKRILATLAAITTLVTIVIIGGSEAARADAPEPMPIEMGRRYVPLKTPANNGWTVRPEIAVSRNKLPVIEVQRIAVEPIQRGSQPVIVVGGATATLTTTPPTTVPELVVVQTYEGNADLNEAEIASLTALNELRASLGLSSLRAAADLSEFAHSWAIIMSETNFEHSSFDDSAFLFTDDRSSFGENIVWHSRADLTPQEAAEEFHQLWVDSPGHYANMVNPIWTEAGIGLFQNEGGWWGVHNFSNG